MFFNFYLPLLSPFTKYLAQVSFSHAHGSFSHLPRARLLLPRARPRRPQSCRPRPCRLRSRRPQRPRPGRRPPQLHRPRPAPSHPTQTAPRPAAAAARRGCRPGHRPRPLSAPVEPDPAWRPSLPPPAAPAPEEPAPNSVRCSCARLPRPPSTPPVDAHCAATDPTVDVPDPSHRSAPATTVRYRVYTFFIFLFNVLTSESLLK
jgi:hypothetical protein